MEQNIRDKYKLSPEEHQTIYKKIEDEVFNEMLTSNEPIAIIVGAQSGAGKGAVITYSKNELEAQGKQVIIITTDEYKPYHPKAIEMAKKYPTEYVSIVEQDAGAWTGKVLRKSIDEGYNFIFEGTLKNERILDRIKEMKEKGFSVTVRVLAVPKLESLISLHERYQKQIDIIGWGRLVSTPHHNQAYSGVPSTVDAIEKSGLCTVEVYTRGKQLNKPELVYSSKEPSAIYPTARIALEEYRKIKETDVRKTAEDRLKELREQFVARGATEEEMKQLENLQDEYINIIE